MKNLICSLTLALSLAVSMIGHADVVTIVCKVTGYPSDSSHDVAKIFEQEFTADESQLAKKPRGADGSCVPQTLRSTKFVDSKKYGSLRISLHRCGPGEPYFYASVVLGTQSFGLNSYLEGLKQGVSVNTANADTEEPMVTPYGPMSSVSTYCKLKVEEPAAQPTK